MLKHWLKIFASFISSLWVLSLLCFALSRLTPDDPVLTQLGVPIEEMSPGNRKFSEFERRYTQIVEQEGLHLPYFYVSIIPLSGSIDLSREYYLPRKHYLQKLLAQTGNPDQVFSYLDAKDRYLKDTESIMASHLRNALDSATNPIKIKSISLQIQSDPEFVASPIFGQLNFEIDRLMEAKSWKSWIPILKWNGFQNQYHIWVMQILRGDWGYSNRDNRPVWQKIWAAFKWTISINSVAIFLIVFLATRWALFTAVRPQSAWSHVSYTGLFMISSLPVFLLAIMALLLFTGTGIMGIFPTPGAFPAFSSGFFWRDAGILLPFLVLPVILIVLSGLPALTRQVHNIMFTELQKEYIHAAILRGVSINKLVHQYAWKNALGVLSVYLGRLIPALISGSIVIESVFNLPGMGSLLIGSIITRDWPVVFGVVFLGGSFSVLGLMIADAVLYNMDPNILKSRKTQTS